VPFREHTLSNGLEIVAECHDQAYSTALGFFVRTGARDETPEIAGVSHFLEHMVFKGTPTRSAEDVNRELDEIGSHSNAFTSEEHTVYYATVLPEYQEPAQRLLSDILRPSLRDDDFETEKQVILEEILKYEDQPPFGAHEKCMSAYFAAHPLGHSILGTAASITGLTPAAMRAYFQHRYCPANIALVAAGRVDFEHLVAVARECCGHWPAVPASRPTPRLQPQYPFQVITKESATQQYVVQIASGPSALDSDRYANRILATILGDDSGSRMFWELVDTGKAECASMGAYEFDDAGINMTFLSCAPEEAQQNLEKLREIQEQAVARGVTEQELQLAKSKIASHLVLKSERPGNRLFAVGGEWIQRRDYQTVKESLQGYLAVTLDDLHRVLERHPPTTTATLTIGPLEHLQPPHAAS